MKTKYIFLFFIFLLVLFSFGSSGVLMGYVNSTGIVFFELNHFNDSSVSKDITFTASGSDTSVGLYLPKNATVTSVILNVEGNYTNTLVYNSEIKVNGSGNLIYIGGLENNGTHLFVMDGTGNSDGDMDTYLYNGTYVATIDTSFSDAPNNYYNGSNFFMLEYYVVGNDWINLHSNLGALTTRYYINLTSEGGDIASDGTYWFTPYNYYNRLMLYHYNGTLISYYNIGSASFNALLGDGFDASSNCGGVDSRSGVDYENGKIWMTCTNVGKDGDYSNDYIFRFTTNGTDYIYDNFKFNVSEKVTRITGITVDGNNFFVSNYTNYVYWYNLTKLYTNNLTISVNSTLFFNNSGTFNTTNTTIDFKDYLQSALSTCTADSKGYCTIPINISSDSAGKITLNNLQINYKYNATPNFNIINWWNETSNFVVGSIKGIAKHYSISTNPDTELNITGFIVQNDTICFIDGVNKAVGSFQDNYVGNLTSATIANLSEWNNYTIYDTSLGLGCPTNQSNATQYSNTTYQLKYFNITAYYPNGTESPDSGNLKIYNVTVEITLAENNLFLNMSPDYGLKWYNGSDWLALNVTNICNNSIAETETNYSTITIGSDIWYGCHNDANNNNKIEYYKILIPHLSNQQFQAFHEEDNEAPNTTIITPTGTYTSASNIPFNVTTSENVAFDSCWYNITNDAGATEKATTSADCNAFNGSFNIAGGNDDYIFYAFANDTSGNINQSIQTFTLSISTSPTGGGGGGGGGTEIIYIGRTCNESEKYWTIENEIGKKSIQFYIGKNSIRDKSVYLSNKGINQTYLNLSCVPSNEGDNICDYVRLKETNITVNPNLLVKKEVKFEFETPPNSTYGKNYYFNIVALDQIDCESSISIKAEVSRLGVFWNRFTIPISKVSEKDDLIVPSLLIISLITAVFFFIFYLVSKSFKSYDPVISFILNIIFSGAIFTVLLFL